MAKRTGANNRKKAHKRRAVRRGYIGRFACAAFACALLIVAGAYLARTYGGRISALAAKLQSAGSAPVEKVVVQGSLHVNFNEMIKRGIVVLPKDIKDFKPERLQALLKACPWIEKIDKIRTVGDTVTLAVSERKPVALLHAAPVCLVDRQGVCLPLPERAMYDLPLLSGLADSTGKDGVRLLRARDRSRMNRFLQEAGRADSSFAAAITQACFGPDRTVAVMVSGGPAVIVFDESEIGEGLQRLARVWEGVQAEQTTPARIDLSYRNLAFVTLRGPHRLAMAAEPKKSKG